MNTVVEDKHVISFSSGPEPDVKIAPIVVGGAIFIGKALYLHFVA